MNATLADLAELRATIRDWCRAHVPADWRRAQTGVGDDEFVAFQQAWFQELRRAGYAVPHWPAEWGGGMSAAEQMVLYQELAAADAPRLVLAFVSIHHAAATLLTAGTDEQRRRHLPGILDGEIWVQGFSEPEAGSDLASLRTTARRESRAGGDVFVVNGQKLWASGAAHADWCLLLARSDPAAPKRRGISYLLMDMRSPGLDVRPIRNALGDSHFCEIFLNDVEIPAENLVGPENSGWQVAQATLAAERGMTMLELAERLGNVGLRSLVETCRRPDAAGHRPIDDTLVADRLAGFDTEIAGLRALCRDLVERHDAGTVGDASQAPPAMRRSQDRTAFGDAGQAPPAMRRSQDRTAFGDASQAPPAVRRSQDRTAFGGADASVVKVYYSELLQRMTGFGAEIAGLAAQTELSKPASSGWESGRWLLDFIGSWEWTIPGGTNEIQRTIIGERGLGLPREP